ADQGQPNAMHNLAVLYITGRGVPDDRVEAFVWLTLAAERYPDSDAARRTTATAQAKEIASHLTPEQQQKAQKLIAERKRKFPPVAPPPAVSDAGTGSIRIG